MKGLIWAICVVTVTAIFPTEGHAQGLGDLFRKIEQISKDPKGSPRLTQISQDIDSLPTDPSSRPKLATILQELEKIFADSAAKDQTVGVYQKWISKYLDVAIVRLQQASLGSKDFDDFPTNISTVEKLIAGRAGSNSAGLSAKLDLVRKSYEAKASELRSASATPQRQEPDRQSTSATQAPASENPYTGTQRPDPATLFSAGELNSVVTTLAANSNRISYEVCQERFKTIVQRDSCAAYVANPASWQQQKMLPFLKASNEVTCNLEKSLSTYFLASLSKERIESLRSRCDLSIDSRLKAIASGAKPMSCQEFKWANLTNSQAGEGFSKWAVYAQPTGALRDIAGELVNAKDQRYLIRQTQIQAEMDAGENLNVLSPMISGRPTIIRKFAVVQVTSKTQMMGKTAQFGRPFGVLGVYRKNESLTMTSGEEIPTQVIEALCVEGG